MEAYRKKYTTFQGPYSPEMIEDLMKKAGENVINNKDNLLREIKAIVEPGPVLQRCITMNCTLN